MPNINKKPRIDQTALIEKGKRRVQLDKVIRNIYAHNRKFRKEPLNIDSDKENCDENAATAKRRKKRPRSSKYARKRRRPIKLKRNRNKQTFMFYCKKKDRKRRKRVRRGYLNEARQLVEYDVRIENFSLNQNVARFHRNAKTLLRDILRLRRRARSALHETIECLEFVQKSSSGVESGAFRHDRGKKWV